MFKITYLNPLDGLTYYLRTTVLTSDMDRAQLFPTREAAQQAIDKAKPFHKARVNKGLSIVAA